MSWVNPIKQRLKEGKSVIGATITTPSVEIAARIADAGFDFLWVEMEHSPITLETLRSIVLATRDLPALPIARVPVNEHWTAKRVLDMGATGVIFPFTTTPPDAERAAASCRYPPRGKRGSGAGLTSFTWPGEGDYYDSADENVLVVAVVEDVIALESIDEIAATPGVDVIFIGVSDLAFSLGLRGQQDHSSFHSAIDRIVAACGQSKKPVGRPAGTAEACERFEQQGFQFFQGPTDIGLLNSAAKSLLEPLGKAKAGSQRIRSFY